MSVAGSDDSTMSLLEGNSRSFASKIALVSRLLRKRFDERARASAPPNGPTLTRAQWRALGTIHVYEGSTQKQLAERLDIGPVAMGQTIDRLEQLQWVERRGDPADRRKRRLYATQAAQPVLARLGILVGSEDHYASVGLAPEKMKLLVDLLDEVIVALSEPPGTSDPAAP